MKVQCVVVLLAAGSLLAFGQAKKSDTASAEKTLIQIENDWAKAYINKDVAAVEKILAEDFSYVSPTGEITTRAQELADLKSGKVVLHSYQIASLKVRIFGDVAVVTGHDTRKVTSQGKDNSGKYVYTDVFVNRNGRWLAVAGQLTKLD